MDIDIVIKNYRCFPDAYPVRVHIGKGFTSFIGVNNAGKSSLLKFFYEFRLLFQSLMSPSNEFLEALKGRRVAFNYASSIRDLREVFNNTNERDLEIEHLLSRVKMGIKKSPYRGGPILLTKGLPPSDR
jgi:AAA15 family ATPase/GTPase